MATTRRSGNFKGGRLIASSGYWIVYVGKGHHLADCRGYAYEHRVVAEQNIGRKLKAVEIVHHINGDKLDNNPSNIEVLGSRFEHKVHHRKAGFSRRLPGQDNEIITCACGCGKTMAQFDNYGRIRKYASGCSWRKGRKGGWIPKEKERKAS